MSSDQAAEVQRISSALIATIEDPLSTCLISLDKSLASQTQTSAQLNITHTSLAELTAYARSRLEHAHTSFKKGIEEARELQRELKELDRQVRNLKEKAREQWPVEYYTEVYWTINMLEKAGRRR